MFLYGSSEPTNTTVGRSGSGAGGRSVNAERSLKAVKTALGGTPAHSSISFDGECRDGARRVGVLDRARRHDVHERGDQPA